jgi:hypothetical protein
MHAFLPKGSKSLYIRAGKYRECIHEVYGFVLLIQSVGITTGYSLIKFTIFSRIQYIYMCKTIIKNLSAKRNVFKILWHVCKLLNIRKDSILPIVNVEETFQRVLDKTYSQVNVSWVRLGCLYCPKRDDNQRKCYHCHSRNEMMIKWRMFLFLSSIHNGNVLEQFCHADSVSNFLLNEQWIGFSIVKLPGLKTTNW